MVDIEELRRLIEPEIVAECRTDIYGDLYGEDRATDAILAHVQAKYRPVIEELARLREREKALVGEAKKFNRAMTIATDGTKAHKAGVVVRTVDWHKLMALAPSARALIKDTPDGE